MITMSKIAKFAHVSVSTVSKAFSMSNEINSETREMIFNIAKEHGCFKKYYKAKYPKHVIAVICPEFEGRFYSVALSLIQKYLTEQNCEICVASTGFSEKAERELLEYYNKYTTVDGVIIIGGQAKTDSSIEIPVAHLFSHNTDNGIISLKSDYKSALEEAVDYFISKNVSQIGFIGEKHTEIKLTTFLEIITDKFGNANKDLISITSDRFETGGYCAMEKFFSTDNIPRAIICAYDYMAIGAIRCIYDHGLTVPDDIAIMGMNDIQESKFLNPPLSSISSNIDEACKIITNAIIGHLTGIPFSKETTVKNELHLRKSTEIN